MRVTVQRWGVALGMAVALLGGGVGEARAATQFWMLQNVTLADGGTVTGSFGYDDVSLTLTDWNIRVQGGSGYLPFTFVPGNSAPNRGGVGISGGGFVYFFEFLANDGAPSTRDLFLSVASDLDGTPTSQPLYLVDPVTGVHYSYDRRAGISDRNVVTGALVLVPFPPPVGLVDVIEFHHAGFDHYFMSADPPEINALDTGYFTGWARTGQQFQAYATGSSAGPTMNPVCRYYGLPSAGLDSHFYSASSVECWEVNEYYGTEWQIESDNVFQIDLPNATTGACPGGTIPVYRVFNHRPDANHRYTTSTVIRSQMEAAGWIREGYGPDATIMCATSF
jgi:Repeat of unknown function (DUF5648)